LHKSDFVFVNGIRLHYLDWEGDGPALVFLPGMGGTAHIFDRLARRFCSRFGGRFHVLALTRRGHGESDYPPTGYDVETLTEDLRLFLDALGIPQVHLVGHSFANVELTHFAALFPQRTLSLVFLDSAIDRTSPAFKKMMQQNPLYQIRAMERDEVYSTFDEYFQALKDSSLSLQMIWGEIMENELRLNSTFNGEGKIIEKMTLEIGAALFRTVQNYRPEEELIRAPTLSIYAYQDLKVYRESKLYSDEQKAQILTFFEKIVPTAQRQIIADFAARVPQAKIIEIPNSHHYCFLYNEDQVYQAMDEFYDGCNVGQDGGEGKA